MQFPSPVKLQGSFCITFAPFLPTAGLSDLFCAGTDLLIQELEESCAESYALCCLYMYVSLKLPS